MIGEGKGEEFWGDVQPGGGICEAQVASIPSILFLVFALCYVFDELIEMEPRQGSAALYATTGVAVFLYAAFYPVLIGLSVPRWYTTCFLQWFLSWPF